jgi:hypothetical protein
MKSWADALDEAIELSKQKGTCKPTGCPLCVRSGYHVRGCKNCPVNMKRCAIFGFGSCNGWRRAIRCRRVDRTALKRAKQLSAYIRKHPRKWQHMNPEDLAREVKKVKI